jgi:uncharacterized membrane protein HdeD (DUF308 family)
MEIYVTRPSASDSAFFAAEQPAAGREIASFWWLWLVFGVAWIVASLVVLQFDQASIATVGIIVGVMFAVASAQQFVAAVITDRLRWLWAIFGGLFAVAAVTCFIHPENTFAALADVLGFLFLCVGVWWMIRAFVSKAATSAWWLELAGLEPKWRRPHDLRGRNPGRLPRRDRRSPPAPPLSRTRCTSSPDARGRRSGTRLRAGPLDRSLHRRLPWRRADRGRPASRRSTC